MVLGIVSLVAGSYFAKGIKADYVLRHEARIKSLLPFGGTTCYEKNSVLQKISVFT